MIKLVVVEDEQKVLDGICALIGKLNPRFEIAGKARNGNEGIETVLRAVPDVVITDIKMPEKDGLAMIRDLRKKGILCQFIILSGHADFHFAQEALKLGSVDYLLKPLQVNDLKKALQAIEDNLDRPEPQNFPPLETYPLNRLLFLTASGGELTQPWFVDELRRRFSGKTEFCAVLVHGDSAVAENQKKIIARMINNALGQKESGICCEVDFDAEHETLYFIAGRNLANFHHHIDRIWTYCGDYVSEQTIFCHESFENADRFSEVFREMRETLRWAISFPPRTLLSRSLIKNTSFDRLAYPLDIEQSLVQKICSGKLKAVNQDLNLLAYYLTEKRCHCTELREAMLSLISAMMYAIRKVSFSIYLEMNQTDIDDFIRKTSSVRAFIALLSDTVSRFVNYSRRLYECSNPIICNMLRIIEAEYNRNISLEIIADRLNLTVEYLSSLFKKELGVGFVVFLTEFRIDHAKKMMAKPGCKIHTVAHQAGYNDTAYFCKVFKRVTGVSPKDYMNSLG